ncbi:lipid A export permease/ATP-binding protein MsbA [Thiohalophilus thiocyanatoxydans]|uniref:Subfamily B ATP-binding cassette protein MsbA n=1 Tax=Thiohalophilus thiocyanatoxydans TaxID=381308 RepID=A0A4R8IZP6_9GAMM|nr:lipid A export permease/ATP-binding protein MsbA [Thiohalophilus thiocyanatoxydans]TDY02943.1 subfamily B ATP-binding cassette protein MsbA [Thiohalophilus thiocyanatoxydans]
MRSSPGDSADGYVIYRRLLRHAFPYWKVFLLAVFGMVIFSLSQGAFAKLIEPMVDGSFVDKDPAMIKWIPILMIIVFAIRTIGSFLSEYGMAWIARSVIQNLRSMVFNKLLCLPIGYYETTSSGGLLSKMVYDIEQLADAASTVVTTLIRDSLTIIVLLVVMMYLSATLTLILLVAIPVIAVAVVLVSKRFRKLSHRIQRSMGDVSNVTEETIEANREIKIFGGQEYETERFEKVNAYNRRQHLKLVATNAISSPLIQQIVVTAFAGIVYIATKPGFLDEMTVGKFMSFMLSMILLLQHAKRLTTINAKLQRGIAAAYSVFTFVDSEPEPDRGTRELTHVEGRVQYQSVTFSYEGMENEPVLSDIELTIEPGESVAFVGRSGAGKSTLVSLLPRFYEIKQGRILIDDVDIKDVTLTSLRSQIALVSQQVTLFNDTIAHNIAYGALEHADETAIREAAEAAYALDFIERLPEGFDTVVGENGVLLSGGQRQRLAIARAILKNAPILILDEATSALDTESERYIQGAIEHLMEDRTTLVIAHRLSTIERVDKIVVLEAGRIVEVGRHDELLAKNGQYASLHGIQFSTT